MKIHIKCSEFGWVKNVPDGEEEEEEFRSIGLGCSVHIYSVYYTLLAFGKKHLYSKEICWYFAKPLEVIPNFLLALFGIVGKSARSMLLTK